VMGAALNTEWAIRELRTFLAEIESHQGEAVVARRLTVTRILDEIAPDWRRRNTTIYVRQGLLDSDHFNMRDRVREALPILERQDELAEAFETAGPKLDATTLHPWVWQPAASAWEAGNYEDAVDAAGRNVNSRLRAKVGRRDLGEGKLLAQVFSPSPPDEGNPRLRLDLPKGIGMESVRSLYGGIIAFGQGWYQAVRNPLAHEATENVAMSEHEALEALAALSLLARWIDTALVRRSEA
jgi:uncharacterized protein (TIGR02391 family)